MRGAMLSVGLLMAGCQLFLESLQEDGNCADLLDNDGNGLSDCDDPACVADSFCQVELAPPNCGDGILDADEECDDADPDNDNGCSNLCSLNGDLFVNCQAQVSGDGSVGAPFNSFAEAVGSIVDNSLRNIVLFNGTCDGNVLIQGKQLFIVSRGARLALSAGGNLIINGSSVIIENLAIGGVDDNEVGDALELFDGAIQLVSASSVALINTQIEFADPDDVTPDAHCITSIGGSFLVVDRSEIGGCDGGGVHQEGASSFMANSLFQDNGSLSSIHGALAETLGPTQFVVFGSTFDGNQSSNIAPASSVMGPCAGGMRVEASIWNNTNSAPAIIGGVGCDVNTSITFGTVPLGGGNTDVDPLFADDAFHLSAGSPAANVLAVIPVVAPFDPNVLFLGFGIGSLDLFSHDFDGKPRVAPFDQGMFEDF